MVDKNLNPMKPKVAMNFSKTVKNIEEPSLKLEELKLIAAIALRKRKDLHNILDPHQQTKTEDLSLLQELTYDKLEKLAYAYGEYFHDPIIFALAISKNAEATSEAETTCFEMLYDIGRYFQEYCHYLKISQPAMLLNYAKIYAEKSGCMNGFESLLLGIQIGNPNLLSKLEK